MPSLPKRVAGVRVPRRLRRKRGLALVLGGITAVLVAARRKAAALAR